MKSLPEQIAQKRIQLALAKPRSELATKLYYQLRDLVTRQIARENRMDKAA